MYNLTNTKKLINLINNKLDKWNERSQFTINKVSNLSISDLETLQDYCNFIIETNGIVNIERRFIIFQNLKKVLVNSQILKI